MRPPFGGRVAHGDCWRRSRLDRLTPCRPPKWSTCGQSALDQRRDSDWAVDQLGPNALGEAEAGTIPMVAPAALLRIAVPQPPGSLVYELLTGHPERDTGELVFVADLTVKLSAWPADTWAKVGLDPTSSSRRSSAAGGTASSWAACRGPRLRGGPRAHWPAMTYVRGQLRGRLTARLTSTGAGSIPPAAADPATGFP
jgi:hypothetical protein